MAYMSNTLWDADFRDEYKHSAYRELSGSKDKHIFDDKENVVPDLSDLTDEEFLERLARMRHEHQHTMAFCDKLGLHPQDQLESKLPNPPYPVASVDEYYTLTTDSHHSSLAGDLITTDFDNVLRPSFKARRAPPQKHIPAGSLQRKLTRKEKEKQLREQLENERQKMREYALDKYLASLSDEDRWDEEEDRVAETKRAKTKHRLVRSSSLSKLVDNGWRYHVTVPKPFKMTIRESQKRPTKSRSAMEFERQKSKQQMEDELECSMKFKASPAPATIYVPLFEELALEKERRRRKNMAVRHKEHVAMQRPFSFLHREKEKLSEKHRRQREMAEADACRPDANFRAKPFPYHLFSSETKDWMSEQEEIREWQRIARAEKLLRTSSLPKNMTKKRPSHVCDMTSEDGCAGSKCDTVKQRSPGRMYVGLEGEDEEHIVSRQEQGSSAERPGTVAAACCCHGDRPRWPHTCLDDVQLSRSFSDVHISSPQVADVRARSPASDRPRPAPKSILKATSRRSVVSKPRPTGGEVNEKTGRRRRPQTAGLTVGRSSPASSAGRRDTSATSSRRRNNDVDDEIRRQIEQDLKHIH